MKANKNGLSASNENWLALYVLSSLIGVVGGFGAVVFRIIIKLIHSLFFKVTLPHITFDFNGYNPALLRTSRVGRTPNRPHYHVDRTGDPRRRNSGDHGCRRPADRDVSRKEWSP